jgi:hypothetical protein
MRFLSDCAGSNAGVDQGRRLGGHSLDCAKELRDGQRLRYERRLEHRVGSFARLDWLLHIPVLGNLAVVDAPDIDPDDLSVLRQACD